jgi:3-oxoacyl-[acyl-carrier-protein] synthase II
MSGAVLLAVGAVSALGAGDLAFAIGAAGERARVAIAKDDILARAGFARPIAARVAAPLPHASDRATALLRAALDPCLARLGEVRPDWRRRRVGLVVGTSSGGMSTAESYFAARASGAQVTPSLARGATYFAPLDAATSALGYDFAPRVLLLGACASSTLALGLALRWLQLGRCDIVLAGGFDAVTEFVASGFEALRATTATLPRPFRADRDGMALGEGAAVVALELADEPTSTSFPLLVGFGASTDAVHLTAPDRTGRGLARAAIAALADANIPPADVALVSAHATATPFNDPAEARSLQVALGAPGPAIVHPFKAQIGHTLGAAGVLESLAMLDAVRRDLAPAAAGEGALDPECAVPLAAVNVPLEGAPALKLSSAFGGANAALVFAPPPAKSVAKHPRPVFLHAFLTVREPFDALALAERLGASHPNVPRLDRMAKLVLTAVHRLSEITGRVSMASGGIVVGHALATLEHNESFDARRRARGARLVEPRKFPATSPNAAAGECAIAFGLTGPSFAVGGSLHGGLEALSVARDLIAAGDVATMVVAAADLTGPVAADWIAAAGVSPLPEGACVALLGVAPTLEGATSRSRATELQDEVPRSLAGGSDWIWTGLSGHVELDAYLRTLRAP